MPHTAQFYPVGNGATATRWLTRFLSCNVHITLMVRFSPKQKFYILHRFSFFARLLLHIPICIFKIILSMKIELMLSGAAAVRLYFQQIIWFAYSSLTGISSAHIHFDFIFTWFFFLVFFRCAAMDQGSSTCVYKWTYSIGFYCRRAH